MRLPNPTWLVGCGNMAGAMVEGWRMAGVDVSGAVAIRPSGKPVEGIRTVSSLQEAGPAPAMVVLGFKPQKLDEVTPDLAPHVGEGTVIVSMLAGITAARSHEWGPGETLHGYRSHQKTPVIPGRIPISETW